MRQPGRNACTISFALMLAWAGASLAQPGPGDTFTYQGQLRLGGTPHTGPVTATFRLFDTEFAVLPLATVVQPVSVFEGAFRADIDFGPGMFDGSERWLEVQVDADILAPRQRVLPAPYAMFAGTVGAVPDGALAGTYSNPVEFTHPLNELSGNGAGITKLNASALTSGTVPGGAIGGTYGNAVTFTNGTFSGNGAGLMSLNASNVTSGNLDPARLPTGGNWSLTSPLNIGVDALIVDPLTPAVDVGTSAANADLTVYGSASASVSAANSHAVYGWHDGITLAPQPGGGVFGYSGTATGVTGWSASSTPGNAIGVYGSAWGSTDSTSGVFGEATSPTGKTNGVFGRAASPDGVGVYAQNTSTSGPAYAVYGYSASPGLAPVASAVVGWQAGGGVVYGVLGTHDDPSGFSGGPASGAGVAGISGTGVGVYGLSTSTGINNTGVWAAAGNEYATGLYADATGDDSLGVHGRGQAAAGETAGGQFNGFDVGSADAYGVRASTNETGISVTAPSGVLGEGGTAIRGESTVTSGNGVVGIANGGSAYAIYGQSDTGFAGRFSGNVHVAGTLSKTAGSFKIDHPLDPEHKYLVHSFVESPDMMNVYNGNVVTDGDGYATVTMPDWFDALNSDFRYQLTVIDDDPDSFVLAKVLEEMAHGAFTIRTSEPWTKVSWQVTGIRRDPWAQANRIAVEPEKSEWEQGYYLHPELYGHGADRNMTAAKAALSERLQDDPEFVAARAAQRAKIESRRPRTILVGGQEEGHANGSHHHDDVGRVPGVEQ